MPRCGECNGCLNYADGFTCDTCKFCIDSSRLGGPSKLHTTCEMRLCVQIKKGKAVDVQRMNISPDEKLSRRGKKRKIISNRRDSGYCNNNNLKYNETEIENFGEDEGQSLEGIGRDSGVGSEGGGRAWGRREEVRREQELVSRVGEVVLQLGKEAGGEVRVVYTPKKHPNLPGMEGQKVFWEFPAEKIEVKEEDWETPLERGAALARLGVSEEEVLSCSLPDIARGAAAILRNAVGLDLARIGSKRRQNRERVVSWLFQFFDLSFPGELREEAVRITWEFLRENLEYVAESDKEEAEAFSKSVMQLPADVVEMATVLSAPCPPIHPSSPTSASSLPQLDLSTCSNQVVVEDDNYCYTATYLDLEQVDHLQSLLSPTRAAPLATSDMHQLTPSSMEPLPVPASFKTAAMKFQGSCQQNKSLHGTSPGLSASEDETGNKRQRRPPNHLKEYTTDKPW